jgi:hypothetical protein
MKHHSLHRVPIVIAFGLTPVVGGTAPQVSGSDFTFGTDTVSPAAAPSYFSVFEMWAPVMRQLTPEAKLKVFKTNYERIFDDGRNRVREWKKANLR